MPVSGEAGNAVDYDAILLAGGRARRLGGVDKPALDVGGVPVLRRVADAAAGARRLVVAGPGGCAPAGAVIVREDPPGCGPVPALRAAMAPARAPWVAVLAGDLPFLRRGDLRELRLAAESSQGAVIVDDGGAEQWLAGLWHTAALRTALSGYDGTSLRGLFGALNFVRIRPEVPSETPPPWLDCDTARDLDDARRWACRT